MVKSTSCITIDFMNMSQLTERTFTPSESLSSLSLFLSLARGQCRPGKFWHRRSFRQKFLLRSLIMPRLSVEWMNELSHWPNLNVLLTRQPRLPVRLHRPYLAANLIGKPEEAKYGLTKEQMLEAYKIAMDKGVKRFGLHTMVISNETRLEGLLLNAKIVFDLAAEIATKLGIKFEFINLGGGIGIPYRPEDNAVDLEALGEGVHKLYDEILVPAGLTTTAIAYESGRAITGPYGYLVSTVLHQKNTYKNYIGLDSCMANLMRPALYGSYHHIVVVGKENEPCDHVYDVTGSLCENNDKFAIDRKLPKIDIGDRIVMFDTGAHGHAMGFNYNGKLRSAELLLHEDGSVELIRRAETIEDYFATLYYDGSVLKK